VRPVFGLLLLVLTTLLGGQATAQSQNCIAHVNHQELIIVAGTVVDGNGTTGLRERLFNWPSRTWDKAWGEPPECDSGVTIAFLANMLSLAETKGYCLADADDGTGFLLVPGERNFRGRCRSTVCDTVDMVAEQSLAVAGTVTSILAGQKIDSPADGVTALASGSGAMLLTGQTPALISALGQGAAALTAALSAPAAAAAAAVTVVTVGGAVYVCS
jgi:predicted RecA/RadA family phage recombinase